MIVLLQICIDSRIYKRQTKNKRTAHYCNPSEQTSGGDRLEGFKQNKIRESNQEPETLLLELWNI